MAGLVVPRCNKQASVRVDKCPLCVVSGFQVKGVSIAEAEGVGCGRSGWTAL